MSRADSSVVEQAREIAERVASSAGLEVVEVEWRGGNQRGVLRIFIDKPGGVTLGDCEHVSKQVSTILDVEDVTPAGAYQLEVSSPGLDRKLIRPDDYRRFAGRKVKLRLRLPHEGRQQFTGRLEGLEDGRVVLDAGRGETLRVPLEDIHAARLVVEIGPDWKE